MKSFCFGSIIKAKAHGKPPLFSHFRGTKSPSIRFSVTDFRHHLNTPVMILVFHTPHNLLKCELAKCNCVVVKLRLAVFYHRFTSSLLFVCHRPGGISLLTIGSDDVLRKMPVLCIYVKTRWCKEVKLQLILTVIITCLFK